MLRYKPITVIRWVFTYGLLIVLPFGTGQLTQVNWPALPVDAIWRMVFVVVGTTYLAYLLNVFALKTVSSTTASFYIYLQPVTAALAAIALGKDELTWILLMAASLIFTGVYFVSFYKPRITNAKTTG
ncbi:MAG: DMT family transporter [Owenweeksia sp.]|nr:DMT family transporter [Owenweeksia sp.]